MPLALAEAMVKLAAEKTRESYPAQMAAALPLVAVQSAGEVPKGAIERTTANLVEGVRPSLRSAFRLGSGKALGRFGAAAVTTPMFLSGIRDLKSNDDADRRRGALKVFGSAIGFSGVKGAIETTVDRGAQSPSLLKAMRSTVGTRTVMGALGGVLTAQEIAGSLKRGKDQSVFDRAKPYLVGSGIGAVEGFGEAAFENGLRNPGAMRAAIAKGTGRAAGGAIGAALITAIAKHSAGKEKRAELVGTDSYRAYMAAYDWSAENGKAPATEQALAVQGQGPLTPYRRAVVRGLVDGATGAPRARPVPVTSADAFLMGVVLAAPSVALGVLETMPPSQRDLLLRDAMDRMAVDRAVQVFQTAELGSESSTGKQIFLHPKSAPAVSAHELGHATAGAARRATTGSAAATLAHHGAAGAATLVPLAVLLTANDGGFASPEDYEARANFLNRLGLVAAAAGAPKLTEEGLASAKGAWYLAQAGATKQQMLEQAFARNLPAFATYAVPFAIPFLAAHRLRQKARPQERP